MKRVLSIPSLAVALVLAPACKTMDTTASAPGYADAAAYAGGEAFYGGAASGMAEREYAEDMKISGSFEEAPAQPAPLPESEPPPPPGELPQPKPEPSPDSPSASEPSTARQIIYTATMLLSVYERDAAMAELEAVPERFGGWIASRQDYLITLRVPAGRLAEVMDGLATLGLVLGKTLQASDVTAQYTDLASRIAVLEQLHEQLLVLLDAAKTVEASLKVRAELERVRLELESAKVRMRALSEQIAFSTLTVSLVQRGADEVLPSSNDPFPWVDELGVESTEFR
jgi:hypothetical protein